MVNTQLLDEKIASSGLRVGFIVEIVGLSRQSFHQKRKGIRPFKRSEVYVLSDLLKLTNEEKIKIFCPESEQIS